jgi:hypothetical protein
MLTQESLGELLLQCCGKKELSEAEVESLCEEFPYFQAVQLYKEACASGGSAQSDRKPKGFELLSDRLLLHSLTRNAHSVDGDANEFSWVSLEQQETQMALANADSSSSEALDCSYAEGCEEREDEPLVAVSEEVQSDEQMLTAATGVSSSAGAGGMESDEDENSDALVQGLSGEEQYDEGVATSFSGESEPTVTPCEEVRGGELHITGEEKKGAVNEERADEGASMDLRGVLDFSLSQEVPEMSPSLSPHGMVGFTLTQQDIDYINSYLDPKRSVGSEEREDQSGRESQTQAERIDNFIAQFDSILSKVLEEERARASEGVEPSDLAEPQRELDVHIASERLAYLLAEKGEYEAAIPMYERLQAQNPEKSSYFADIIERLRQRERESSK